MRSCPFYQLLLQRHKYTILCRFGWFQAVVSKQDQKTKMGFSDQTCAPRVVVLVFVVVVVILVVIIFVVLIPSVVGAVVRVTPTPRRGIVRGGSVPEKAHGHCAILRRKKFLKFLIGKMQKLFTKSRSMVKFL